MDLGERKLKILETIVDNYVSTGEPVSSKFICNNLDASVSSATIRNEMAELTTLGLLEQPHTSSGRIPSQLGYRIYINCIMNKRKLSEADQRAIDNAVMSSLKDPDELLEGASQILAELSNFAVAAIMPAQNSMKINNLQIAIINKRSGMIILITSCGIMRNRLFFCDYDLNEEILEICQGILNDLFKDVYVSEITPNFIQTAASSLGDISLIISPMLFAVYEAAKDANESDVKLQGKINLLFLPEFKNQKSNNLFDFLDKDDEIARLLLQEDNKNTRVLIGEESKIKELQNSSVIISKYNVSEDKCGAIGIIGPTRMDYPKLISDLEYLSSVIEKILKDILDL